MTAIKNLSYAKAGNVILTAHAVYEFSDSDIAGTLLPKEEKATPWYPWGAKNNDPDLIFKDVYNNDILPSNIELSYNLIYGKGLIYWLEKKAGGIRTQEFVDLPEVDEFVNGFDISAYFEERITNLETFANAFTEFLFSKEGKVISLKNLTCVDARSGFRQAKSNQVEWFYLCGDWRNPNYNKDNIAKGNVIHVPALSNTMAVAKFKKGISQSAYYLPGQDYYSFPIWWYGIQNWLKLSKKISTFQLALMDNSINPRFHVIVPPEIFKEFKDESEREAAKDEIVKQVESFLTGAENAGKTFVSFPVRMGDKTYNVEINPIEAVKLDDMFLNSFDTSTRAISRASGVHPSLAGIDIGGTLSSGSEIFYNYNFHVSVKMNKRRNTILRDMEMVRKLNGWPSNLKFGFEQTILTNIDKNPNGKQNAAL